MLIPLALLAIVVAFWRLRRTNRLTSMRLLVGAAAALYAVAVVNATFFPLYLGRDSSDQNWRVWIAIVPFKDIVRDPIGLILNAALFVPLGVLLPLIARVSSAWRILFWSLLLSFSIEFLQFVGSITFSPGRVADSDDLIANCVGALIGYGVFILIITIPPFARLAERATWPESRSPAVAHNATNR